MDKSISHPGTLSDGSRGGDPEQNGVRTLGEDECWELLEGGRFGRLGTRDGDEIEIIPVNYVADGRRIFFRTGRGSKQLRLSLYTTVAFEIDRVAGGQAVSVIVRGEARTLTDAVELERFERLGLRPWTDPEKLEVVEIAPYRVTGRRFRLQG